MTAPYMSIHVIDELTEKADTDGEFADLLVASLHQAKAAAEAELDADLFNALAWAEDIDGYVVYLKEVARWTHRQS
jgi:hypothetical protein